MISRTNSIIKNRFKYEVLRYLDEQFSMGFNPRWLVTWHFYNPDELIKHQEEIRKLYGHGSRYGSNQELWKIDPNTREKKSIKKAFSIEKFAEHCESIGENPLFFATVKEYFFLGGWAEPRHLTIFDLDGNKLGIAPNWEYAEQFCDFY